MANVSQTAVAYWLTLLLSAPFFFETAFFPRLVKVFLSIAFVRVLQFIIYWLPLSHVGGKGAAEGRPAVSSRSVVSFPAPLLQHATALEHGSRVKS